MAPISETKFRALLEAAPDAIVIVDAHGCIELVNARAEELFGYRRDEMLGEPVELLVPEQARKLHVAHRDEYIRDARTRPMGAGLALSGRRHDGSEFPVEISLSPVHTPEGSFTISAIRDVTERRNADERFRALLESAPDSMVIVNDRGTIVLVNAQTERLFGYDRDELLGQSVEILVPERARGAHVGHRNTYFHGAHPRPMGVGLDLYGRRKDGTEFPVEISLSPLSTGEGTLVASAIRDLTERREAEEERTRLIRERAAHAEANRVKDEFLATLSHELRTPLNAILGWTTLLRDRQLDIEVAGKALATIERNARAQVQLIEDLLDVSRIVTGKLRLQTQPMDLATVVDHAVDVVRPAADARRLTLEVVLEARPLLMMGDPDRLQQAIWNLLSNAEKFSNDGGRISVRLWVGERKAHLVIRDTGCGIPREFLPHVFDRFRQADSSYTRAFGGLGLGLSIVRSIVELHGGSVSVQSEGENRGAVFAVDLPLMHSAPADTHHPSLHLSDEALAKELAGLAVLVVDDQPDERELLSTLLGRHGATVQTAPSVDAALKLVVTNRPDIIVTDLAMPVADGYVLLRRVRELPPPARHIPVVAVTAHARAEDREQALAAGFQLYVAKPVEPKRLLGAVAALMRRSRAQVRNQ